MFPVSVLQKASPKGAKTLDFVQVKHLRFALQAMFDRLECLTCHKHCLKSRICLTMFLKIFKNIFYLYQAKNVLQEMICDLVKRLNSV